MNDDSEVNLDTEDNIADILDGAETTSDGIDRFQRLRKTGWSNDFKQRLAQVILGATALMTVNHWGVDMPVHSWIGNADLPVQQSAEDSRREDSVFAGRLPPEIDPNSLPAELRKEE